MTVRVRACIEFDLDEITELEDMAPVLDRLNEVRSRPPGVLACPKAPTCADADFEAPAAAERSHLPGYRRLQPCLLRLAVGPGALHSECVLTRTPVHGMTTVQGEHVKAGAGARQDGVIHALQA